jgi:hypothetical protein
MNQLTKVLLEDLLEDGKKKITAIYGGGFKPPTKGHFDVVVKAAKQNPEIDDFLIYVGGGERNSITQGESIQIWELYKKYLPMKVQVVPVKSPIGDILRYAKEHPEEEILWVIGARENNPEDFADIASRTRTLNKYPNIELRVIQTSGGISGTATRKAAKDNNKEQFFKMIPDIEEKDQVWDTVTSVVTEVGEANLKPYKWQEVDREGYSIYIRFETESETTYSVDLSTDKYKDTPVFLVEFSAKTKEHQGSSSRVVVNKGEMYRVMSTLTDIIKTYLKKFKKVKGIVYYPSKKGNEEFGTQRDNLYRAFITKAIPGIKFEPVNTTLYGDGIVALMPDTVIKEIVTDTEVICDNCGWEWSIEDGGDDLYICHKCGHDNNPDLGEASDPEAGTALPYGSGFAPIKENASYSKDIDVKEKILELTKHMLAKGMNIKPLPKVKFVNGDRDNARDFLGRTAYYNPNNSTITLYTEGRHPKDIVRSFSHEMIHHMQNLEDRLGDVSTTNTMEDDNIDKLEQEANLKGTMTFRNWTDSLNENIAPLKNHKVYHSTDSKFEDFSLDYAWDGFWFTDDLNSLKNKTAGASGGKYILTRYITLKNPAGWDEYDKYSIEELISMGYDGVILPDPGRADYIVFNPKSISKNIDSLNENIFQKSLDQTEKEALEITYKDWDTFGGKECNNGFCDIFAKNLAKHLPGSKILSTEDPRNETLGHVWVEYQGKYFDAETPNGVSSWRDLPWMKEFYSKVGSYPTDIETLNETITSTMTFRNWTDSLNESLEEATQYIWKHREDIVYLPLLETKYKLKQVMNEEEIEQTYLDEYKQKFLTELFEKDLPIIDKVSKNLYIVSNGDDIEAKYDIRLEIPERDLWSINWFFTPDNKNKSPEAWKQVTATSFKVLEDWLKTNNPKAIYISGNTGAKTKLYKTYIDKLQILLNNRYKIDNTDEDRVVLRSIEETSQSGIKKRMETLNESYEQALNYWKNGDINSKSKIERWGSIKKKIERQVLQEVYKLTDSYNQLKEEETVSTEPIQQYTIYCDMDGVLVDFDKGYKALTGKETTHVDVQGKNEFWGTFRNGLEGRKMSEKDYWANLQWMPDGKDLWNHIKQYKPTLLSAPSRDPQSRWGKRIWVKKNIPGTPLILAYAESKKNYANKTSILIDDRISNINDWNAAGGIGILHTSTETTLEKLSKYGI